MRRVRYVVSGICFIVALLLVGGVSLIEAQTTWDKSTITLTGQCLQATGQAEFTVTNNGLAMAGTSDWREYEAGTPANNGTFQLGAGAAQVWTFGPLPGVAIRFEADQRPGHPGNSHPSLTLTCDPPTAVKVRSFLAVPAGIRDWRVWTLIARVWR